MKKVLITGATGFVGQAFLNKVLENQCYEPVIVTRQPLEKQEIQQEVIDSLSGATDFSLALANVDVVVHIAGRAHVLKEGAQDPLQAFHTVNVDATIQLVKQAIKQGVQRFIFISSIGVNGQSNHQPFTEEDTPNPQTPYATSKYEAEQALMALTEGTALELVIIRPPLVYGKGVKANFLSLLKWVQRGIPLPLGAINNQRSFVALDNLIDFICVCMVHPKAANQTFLVADKETISTSALLKNVAKLMNTKQWLVPVPVCLLKGIASLLGRKHMTVQLCDSLQVDITKAETLLDWKPPKTLQEALKITVDDFLHNKESQN